MEVSAEVNVQREQQQSSQVNESTPISSSSSLDRKESRPNIPAKPSLSRVKYILQSELGALNREKEQHKVRLHDLRKELNHITSTDWQFEPIEKLIGRNNH